ncbi:MAG: glycosyltransferase family 39 protein [Nitrospirota bacterium]|nr:glycosyltransferase family 39 protein [Nitrospirota bacterium]
MSALSPCISFVFILLISRTSGFSWRESILAAAVVWGLLLTIITEALSVFEAFSSMAILSSWLLSGAVLASLYMRLRRGRSVSWDSVPSMASLPFPLLLPIGFIVSLTGLIALVAPPNNYDSMTYHLSRVVHWIQNHDVRPYPTNIDRQLFMPPWAEFAITHLYVLNGGDRLANAVQWLSMLGSIVGVSLIAKQLGGDRDCQALASLVAVCLPMGILQASSTQNDYVVTFWLVCFVYYVVRILRVPEEHLAIWPQGILAGISLGLALFTKTTAYLLAPPFLVWLTVALPRKLGVKSLKIVISVLVIALVINFGHYARNFEVFGSPLAPPSRTSGLTTVSDITHEEFTRMTSRFASSLIRNTALEMATPFYYGNRIVEVAVEKLEILFRLKVHAEKFRLLLQQNHEDFAGNPIHLLLIGFCGAVMIGQFKRGSLSIGHFYILSLLAGYLTLCLVLKWNIYITRLHLPLFVLWSAAIATALSEPVFVRTRSYIIVLLVVTSQYALFYNESRPLIGAKSIFALPRWEQYFRNSHPGIISQYSYAVSLLKDKRCAQVGLWLDKDSWEYPLWILLSGREGDGLRIEHIRISNQSARVSLRGGASNFVPCGLVVVETNEMPDQIIEGDRPYSKTWMGDKVAVYQLENDPLQRARISGKS